MKLYLPFPFRAVDDLLAPKEFDQWSFIRESIEGNLVWLDEEKGNINQKELPFIYAFEDEVKDKLVRAGFKKDFWGNQADFQKLLQILDKQGLSIYGTWDHLPYGFPASVVIFSKDRKTFSINSDIAASLRTLNSIMIIKQSLLNNGHINKEAVKVFLHSFELIINLLRSSNLIKIVSGGKTFKINQKLKRGKRKTWRGLNKEEIKKRNQKITDKFNNSKLTSNNFANKYQNEFDLKPSQIRTIIRKA